MDNLSHTLIGVLAGEAIALSLPHARPGLSMDQRRNMIVCVMALGSNLPDLDFIPSLLSGNKLDYLLQHRGYTHTAVGAIVIAVVTLAACEAWMRFRGRTVASFDRLLLFGVALFAPMLHIAMDFGNSYGVHPFWPVNNDWFYGDSVFIAEPSFWVAATPLVFVLRTIVARALVVIVLLGGIAAAFFTGLVPLPLSVLMTALMAALLGIGRYCAPRVAVLTGLGVWLCSTLLFAIAGRVVAGHVAALEPLSTKERTLDHVLTPMPLNPFCWDVLLIQAAGDDYRLRDGKHSLAPHWIPANACPSRGVASHRTAHITRSDLLNTPSWHWHSEVIMSAEALRALASQSCQASGLLRFARAPFYARLGDTWVVGDLRYDREREAGFAEVKIGQDTCASTIPPWTAPRIDLLGPTIESDRSSLHR